MRVRFTITGQRQVNAALSRISRQVEQEVKNIVAESALDVQNMSKQAIADTKHGTLFERIRVGGQTIRNHRASAPGEAPANLTGRLQSSIRASFSQNGLSAEIGTNVKYGKFLEFGTSKMAARPFLLPAFVQVRRVFVERIREAIRRNSRRSG